MLNENTPEDFSFNVNATRFEFLGYVFKKPNIKIDVGAYFNETTNTAIVDGAALEKLILKQVVDDGFVTQLSFSQLTLTLEQLSFTFYFPSSSRHAPKPEFRLKPARQNLAWRRLPSTTI